MEAKEGSAAHSRSFGFYNGRGPKKIQTKQPASHAGDPCARQTANGNSGFAYTDASISCTAMACDVALQPQSMELASLTGGSQSAKDVAIWTGDLASACTNQNSHQESASVGHLPTSYLHGPTGVGPDVAGEDVVVVDE
ncbi:hypothetical protein HKD37_U058075 [Glycine soja]